MLLLALFNSSCRHKSEVKIVGTWKRIMIDNVNATYQETWTFFDDGKLYVYKDADWQSPTQFDSTARYMVNARVRKTYIRIEDATIDYYNGAWEIIKLNRKVLMIVKRPPFTVVDIQSYGGMNVDRLGGLLFREFVKVKSK